MPADDDPPGAMSTQPRDTTSASGIGLPLESAHTPSVSTPPRFPHPTLRTTGSFATAKSTSGVPVRESSVPRANTTAL
jgi:hypothetical protein